MTETVIGALVGAGAVIIAQTIAAFVSYKISKLEMKQRERQSKKDTLNEIYERLILVVNLFPSASPNDRLKYVEYPPNYSREHFDSILRILDYQIEDYRSRLGIPSISYEKSGEIEVQISNREYAKKEIAEIRDGYYKAKDKYEIFVETEKALFDLHAGQRVRNFLVEFEVVIHNVFIAGRSVGEADDPLKNIIIISRRNLVDSMRNDIGIS